MKTTEKQLQQILAIAEAASIASDHPSRQLESDTASELFNTIAQITRHILSEDGQNPSLEPDQRS